MGKLANEASTLNEFEAAGHFYLGREEIEGCMVVLLHQRCSDDTEWKKKGLLGHVFQNQQILPPFLSSGESLPSEQLFPHSVNMSEDKKVASGTEFA